MAFPFRNLLCSVLLFFPGLVSAQDSSTTLPSGGQITSGSGSVHTTPGQMVITQNSRVLDTNWSSFDIGSSAGVSILQPNNTSTFIGRIGGGSPSSIDGALSANGRVVLVNPNGVVFGAGSRVNVGGLVASALNLRGYNADGVDLDFGGSTGGVVRQEGVIRADYVALVGSSVKQAGSISASRGDVALLAGDQVAMSIGGSGLISASVSSSASAGSVDASGSIEAPNGTVLVRAEAASDILSRAIHGNQSQELRVQDGRLLLVDVSGEIEAERVTVDAGGEGAASVSAEVTATVAGTNTGGRIDVLGHSVTIENGAILNASGELGGGLIQVGGSWQNSDGSVRQSTVTRVLRGGRLIADALHGGDGGEIVVWSDVRDPNSSTSVAGTLSASAMGLSGSGGRIETSGFSLVTDEISVEASSVSGASGTWLLDPYNITISSATSNVSATNGTYTASAGSATIDVSDIATALSAGTSVTISTAGDGSDAGDILWNGALDVSLNTSVSLILQAHGDITIEEKIEASGTGALDVTLNTNFGAGVDSNVVVNDYILTNGGDITIGGGSAGDGSGYVVGTGYAVRLNESIRSYGGDITIRGKSTTTVSSWAGVFIDSQQIYADAGRIAIYGQYSAPSGSGLEFGIGPNIADSGWVPDFGVPAGVDDRGLRSVLYSSSATGNAVYLYSGSQTTSSNAVGINFHYVGGMLTNTSGMANTPPVFASGGGNVVLETEEFAGATGGRGGRIRLTNGVYVNGGEYHLITSDGFASHEHYGSSSIISSTTIGLDRLSGVYSNYVGTTGNPKTIIRTDASALSFSTRSAGDLSIYGYTNPDVLSTDYSVAFKVNDTAAVSADIVLYEPISNLRLTGGDVRLRRITAGNVQVVAENIYINDYDTSIHSGNCATNSGSSLSACKSNFGSAGSPVATAYLRATSSIEDSQTNILAADAKMYVEELILESPYIDLRHGGFKPYDGSAWSQNFDHHMIGTVAVRGTSSAIYLSNAQALTIGSLSAVSIDPTISSVLTQTVSGISTSDRLVIETASGNLTVSAPISSSGTGLGTKDHYQDGTFPVPLTEFFNVGNWTAGGRIVAISESTYTQSPSNYWRYGDYFDYPVVLNAGFKDSGHTDGSLVFSTGHAITMATGTRALLLTGGVGETVGIANYVGDGQSRYGARKSNLYQPNTSTASSIQGLAAFDSTYVGIYREQPTISVAPTSATQTVVYGGSIDTTSSISGLVGLDAEGTVLSGSVAYAISGATSTSGNPVVGDHTLSFTGLSNSVGYTVSYTDGDVSITSKPITVSYTSSAKTYDGSVNATVAETITGLVSGDLVTIQETAVFDSPDVAYASGSVTAQTISISSAQLAGADSANYSLGTTSYSSSAQINPKTVTVSGTRAYDGTATFSASDLSLTTGISGQSLTLSGAATANSASVASATYLSDVSSLTLVDGTGGTAANYAISTGQDNLVSVTQRTVGLSFARTYNGYLAASGADFTVTTGVSGEGLTVSGAGTLDSSNVSSVTGLSSMGTLALADGAGGLAANYALPSISSVAVSLTPYEITGAPNAVTRAYDGTSDAPSAATLIYTADDVDTKAFLDVKYSYTGGSFDSANVTDASQFTYTGGTILEIASYRLDNGTLDQAPQVTDFTIASTAAVSGTITPYTLTGSDMSFAVSGPPSAAAITPGDATISDLFGQVITFEVASGQTLSASESGGSYYINSGLSGATISADGTASSNFVFDTSSGVYEVTGSKIILTFVAGSETYSREYDGTTDVMPLMDEDPGYTDWSYSLGDATFNPLNGAYYNSSNKQNYWVLQDSVGNVYSTSSAALAEGPGIKIFFGSDLTFDVAFDSADAGSRSLVFTNAAFNSSSYWTNQFSTYYEFAASSSIPATITPRTLLVDRALPDGRTSMQSFIPATKYYDGTSNIADSLVFSLDTSRIVSGESVSLADVDTFAAKRGDGSEIIDAGSSVQFTISQSDAFDLEGADSSNYRAIIQNLHTYNNWVRVYPRIVTLSANKQADGNAEFSVDDVTVVGAVAGESLSLEATSVSADAIRAANLVNGQVPDPTSEDQIGYLYPERVNNRDFAIYLIQQRKDAYDSAVDAGPLDTPLLSADADFANGTYVEDAGQGTNDLLIKSFTTGDLAAGLASPDASATLSNYCLTRCSTLSGSYYGHTTLAQASDAAYGMENSWSASITAPPTVPLTLSGFTLSNKLYDGSTSGALSLVSNWGTLAGAFSGSDQSTVSLDTSSATLTFGQVSVGSSISVTVANLGLTGTNSSAYSVADFTTTADITARPISLTASSVSKTYGDADPTLAVTAATATGTTGLASTDTLAEVTGTLTRESGENVGSYDVALGSGSKASNYSITFDTDNNALTIGQRSITLAATSVSKVYGESDPTLAVTINSGSLGSSTVSDVLADVSGTLTRESGSNVGSYDVVLGSGTAASNYDITFVSDNDAVSITARPLTATGSVSGKTYDGTTDATVSLTLSNLVGSETVSSSVAAAFGSANAGTQTATVSSVTLSDGTGGGLANNYSLSVSDITLSGSGQATISPASLTATASVADKTYDGTDTASVTLSLSGLVGSEDLSQTVSASFTSALAGTRTASIDSFSLSNGSTGLLANYSLSSSDISFSNNTATIAQKELTVSGSATATDKVYDGSTSVTADITGLTFSGLVGADSLGTASAAFANANVGEDKAISISFSGGDGANYIVPSVSGLTADITARPLTATGSVSGKTYDGTTDATVSLTLSNLVGSETVSSSVAAAFGSANAGTQTATVSSVTLSDGTGGGLANNYSLSVSDITLSGSGQAAISPASLTATASVAGKTYDGTTSAEVTLSLAGVVTGETLGSSVSAVFDSPDAGRRTATISSFSLINGTGLTSNYTLLSGNISFTSNTALITSPGGAYRLGRENAALPIKNMAPMLISASSEQPLPQLQRRLPNRSLPEADATAPQPASLTPSIANVPQPQPNAARNVEASGSTGAQIVSASQPTQPAPTQAAQQNSSPAIAAAPTSAVNSGIPANQPVEPAPVPAAQQNSELPTNSGPNVAVSRNTPLMDLMLSTSGTRVVRVSDNSSINSVLRPEPIVLEEEEVEVRIEDIVPGVQADDTINVAVALPDGSNPVWVGVDRATQSLRLRPSASLNSEQTIRVGVSDDAGNMAAVSLRVVVSTRNSQPAQVAEQTQTTQVVDQPQPSAGGAATASASTQNLPGFLSVQALRPNRVAPGARFVVEVPSGTFVHENSGEPLRFVATLADGSPLPSWITFNPETQTFSGEAPEGSEEELDVIVKAIDSSSQEAQVQMRINVE